MPCYNAEAFLEATVANVFQQTYSNIELIIVDDHGKDNTKEIIKKFNHPQIKYFYSNKKMT